MNVFVDSVQRQTQLIFTNNLSQIFTIKASCQSQLSIKLSTCDNLFIRELISNNFTGVFGNIVSFLFELCENKQTNKHRAVLCCRKLDWLRGYWWCWEPAVVLGRVEVSVLLLLVSRLVRRLRRGRLSRDEPAEEPVNIGEDFPRSRQR